MLDAHIFKSVVHKGYTYEDTDQHDLTIIKRALDYVAVEVKDSSMQFLGRETLVGCFYSCFHVVYVLAQSLFYFAIARENQLGVEVVAIEIDGLTLIDLAGEENHTVFESHGEVDVLILIEIKHSLNDGVVGRFHICVWVVVRS